MTTSNLHDMTVAELAQALKSKQVSAVEVATGFLARLGGNPHNTFLDIDSEVTLAQAQASDARLELQPDESERMLTQINGFFGIVEAMQAVDTTGILPMAHPVAAIQDITLRLRPDVASEPNQRDLNQRSAPAVERGLFLVPKVIE